MASNLRYRDYESPTHPMADFLTKQLPMMIQQHKQNKSNRIHEKDMAQMRLDGQKEVAQLNADLRQSEMLAKNKLTDLGDRKERALTNLDKVNQQLMDQGIVASQWGKIKDPSDASKEIIGKLGEDAQRNFEFAQQEYNSVEEGISVAGDELGQITEQLRQSEAVMGGVMFGNQKAMDIKDFNNDDKLDALDVLNYFKVKNAGEKSLEEATAMLAQAGQDVTGMDELNKHGFNIGFKSAQEAFYKPLESQSLITQRADNTLIKQEKVKANQIKKESKDLGESIAKTHNIFVSQIKQNRDRRKHFNKLLTSDITKIPATTFKNFDDSKFAMELITDGLSDNIYGLLNQANSGLFDWNSKTIDDALGSYKKFENEGMTAERKTALYDLSVDLLGKDNQKSSDSIKNNIGGDFNNIEKEDLVKMLKHYKYMYENEHKMGDYTQLSGGNSLGFSPPSQP